ncbi:hypothetical protein [uncultured Sphingorhabdus sp.]|uniref:hypothetical protein n=1 Tax=uncultured Sphingorhabdus sp. TaxID=1686106 RepID=UPI002617086E|nr:hypothetical protein [uncultured Sphingorhabdus sp.]HMS21853.1 hypothetical protein [Sphingorhabdus sp.]
MTTDERETQAKQRFIILNVLRFSGAVIVMMGLAISAGRLFPEFPPFLGYLFIVLGMFEFFLFPILLKKSWNKKDAGQD